MISLHQWAAYHLHAIPRLAGRRDEAVCGHRAGAAVKRATEPDHHPVRAAVSRHTRPGTAGASRGRIRQHGTMCGMTGTWAGRLGCSILNESSMGNKGEKNEVSIFSDHVYNLDSHELLADMFGRSW